LIEPLEVYSAGSRIASHEHKQGPGFTTLAIHQPDTHRHHMQWTLEGALKWARTVGEYTYQSLSGLLKSKAHPQQQYRLFLGFTQLGRCFGEERLEAACQHTLKQEAGSYQTIKAVLEKGLDRHPLPNSSPEHLPINHSNIRGPAYYQGVKQ
jgi:hypothetical protein